jgi:hypothetical protein
VAILYAVNITTSTPQALVNVAELGEAGGGGTTATVTVIANPYTVFLPLIQRGALAAPVGR